MNNTYSDELQHFGVPGMRWGHRKDPERSSSVRRPRSQYYGQETPKRKFNVKKAAAIAVGVGATAAIAAYAYKHPEQVKAASKKVESVLKKAGSKSVSAIKIVGKSTGKALKFAGKKTGSALKTIGDKTSPKIKNYVTTTAGKLGKFASDASRRATDAAIDSVFTVTGATIAAKIAANLSTSDTDDEKTAYKKSLVREASISAVNAATGNKLSNMRDEPDYGYKSNNNNNGGGNKNADAMQKTNQSKRLESIESAVGKPSGNAVSKQSPEWSKLFVNTDGSKVDTNVNMDIRSMQLAGYDAKQIREYVDYKFKKKQELNQADNDRSIYIGAALANAIIEVI